MYYGYDRWADVAIILIFVLVGVIWFYHRFGSRKQQWEIAYYKLQWIRSLAVSGKVYYYRGLAQNDPAIVASALRRYFHGDRSSQLMRVVEDLSEVPPRRSSVGFSGNR